MSDILLEVDDEIRSQQIKALWQKYGQILIGMAVIGVIGTALGVFWHDYKNAQLQKDTDRLLAITGTEPGKTPDLKALDALAQDSTVPLKAVIGLKLAQEQEKSGDLKSAQASFERVAKENDGNDIVHDMAQLQAMRLAIVQKQDADGILTKLNPLTKKDSAFRSSALEMKGLILLQQNKTSEANAIFQQLADDELTPNSIRQRAHAMIDYESK